MRSQVSLTFLLIICFLIPLFSQSKDDILKWNNSILTEFSDVDLTRLRSGSTIYNQIRFNLLSDEYFKPIFGKSFLDLREGERKRIEAKVRRLKGKKKGAYKWARKLDFYLWGVWGHKNQTRAYEKAVVEIKKLREDRKAFTKTLHEIQSGNLSKRELLASKWNDPLKIYLLPSELDLIKEEIDKQIQIHTESAEREHGIHRLLEKLNRILAKSNTKSLIKELEDLIVAIDNWPLYAHVPNSNKIEAKLSAQKRIDEINNATQDVASKGELFLRKNSKKPNITVLPSGLQYEVIVQTKGAKPKANSEVTIHYIGSLIDGKVFDDTYDVGVPYTESLNSRIPAMQEIIPLMSVGSKYRIYSPSQLAYGEKGFHIVKPYSVVIIELELVSFK